MIWLVSSSHGDTATAPIPEDHVREVVISTSSSVGLVVIGLAFALTSACVPRVVSGTAAGAAAGALSTQSAATGQLCCHQWCADHVFAACVPHRTPMAHLFETSRARRCGVCKQRRICRYLSLASCAGSRSLQDWTQWCTLHHSSKRPTYLARTHPRPRRWCPNVLCSRNSSAELTLTRGA